MGALFLVALRGGVLGSQQDRAGSGHDEGCVDITTRQLNHDEEGKRATAMAMDIQLARRMCGERAEKLLTFYIHNFSLF